MLKNTFYYKWKTNKQLKIIKKNLKINKIIIINNLNLKSKIKFQMIKRNKKIKITLIKISYRHRISIKNLIKNWPFKNKILKKKILKFLVSSLQIIKITFNLKNKNKTKIDSYQISKN